jgi:hypothetical protein
MRKNRVILLSALVLCLLCVLVVLPASAATPSYNGYERSLMVLVNQERMAAGLPPLSMIASLQSAAGVRAQELHTLFSHTRPDGSSCFSVLSQFGVSMSKAGENVAYGYERSSDVMNDWMNSPGHRSNILTSHFTHGGMGYDKAEEQYETGWCQLFISQNCTYSNLRFSLPAGGVVVPAGTRVENMDVVAIMDCSVHGESHFPLVSAMAHPKTAPVGDSEITVSLFGQSASFPVSAVAVPDNDTSDLPTGDALPGDANDDKVVDILDLLAIIDHIISGTSCASMDNADANGDGDVNILDLMWIVDQTVAS